MTVRTVSIVAAAHAALKSNVVRINALNVYPVPDGDTGTNMLLTLESILKESNENSYESVESAAKAASRAALMGARGNSGVILSQMIRGACDSLASCSAFSAEDFAAALEGARDRAYSSTRQPVEGTMLTVIKDAATAAREALSVDGANLDSVSGAAALEAHASVKRTPDLLDVLKEAGVVDAGGLGVAVILDGIHAALTGKTVEIVDEGQGADSDDASMPDLDAIHAGEEAWGYCTEFIVTGFTGDSVEFEDEMNDSGKSVLVISDDDLVKVHLHTQDPGSVMSYAGRFGRLAGVKVDDMEAQVGARLERPATPSETPLANVAVVAAVRGAGNRRLFEEMGAGVIEGGQGANPSAQDFADEVQRICSATGAESVILLPNNKNIIPTAGQVSELVGQDVHIVPTRTIAAGIAVMVAYDTDAGADELIEEMGEVLENLRDAEVTKAVRDARVDGLDVSEGSYLGMIGGRVVCAAESVEEASLDVMKELVSDGAEILTLVRGEELSDESLGRIVSGIETLDDEIEVDVQDGGQPLYHLQVAAE